MQRITDLLTLTPVYVDIDMTLNRPSLGNYGAQKVYLIPCVLP